MPTSTPTKNIAIASAKSFYGVKGVHDQRPHVILKMKFTSYWLRLRLRLCRNTSASFCRTYKFEHTRRSILQRMICVSHLAEGRHISPANTARWWLYLSKCGFSMVWSGLNVVQWRRSVRHVPGSCSDCATRPRLQRNASPNVPRRRIQAGVFVRRRTNTPSYSLRR